MLALPALKDLERCELLPSFFNIDEDKKLELLQIVDTESSS